MPTRTRRSQETRERIASIAAGVIGELGYARATLEVIAERSGVTRATVYYHYDSKEELYAAALVAIMEEFDRAIEAVASTPASVEQQLAECIRVMFEAATGPQRRYQPLPEPALLTPEGLLEIAAIRRRYEHRVAEIIRTGQEAGCVAPGEPLLLARILITSVGRVARWFDPSGRIPPDEVVAMLHSMFLFGLLARDGNFPPRRGPQE